MQKETRRRGLFWDVQEGRVAPPPAAVLLGWELVRVDLEQGTGREVCFLAGELLGPDGCPVAVATATARIQTVRGEGAPPSRVSA
ncbi:hypothetical protein GCM10010412_074940 [Nonomuraea recticatena]|uniref:Uncharacterized protein n=1 Tax=Nonomuraea recticatena TaxID=46178 RepID=A0ABP6FAW2_9ACTN